MKKILILLIPLIVFAQGSFFNPFQFGIKTTKEVREITDSTFLNKVREKAAELLNRNYATSGLFVVSGNTIISNDPQILVNQAVRENYGSWNILLTQAADEVIRVDQVERERLAQILGIDPADVLDLAVLNVKIQDGRLRSIYVGPRSQQGFLPRINPCEEGIGQCSLWILTFALRFVYSLALFLGVILLIWAGILYITKPTEASQIHSRFYYGLLGVIVAVLAFSFVIALERGLTGGGIVVTTQNQGQQNGGNTGNQQQRRGRIYIDQSSIIYSEQKINFIANANIDSCDLNIFVYNLTKARQTSRREDVGISTSFETIDTSALNVQSGDTLRLYFSSNNCNLNLSQYTLRVPTERVEVVLNRIEIELYGGQQFRINSSQFSSFSTMLNTILQNILRPLSDYYLFDPPFYIRFNYSFESPPQTNGNCKISLSVRSAYANNISFDTNGEIISAQWNRFTRLFSFNLPYERNIQNKVIQLPINLPKNTFIQVGYTILNIENCNTRFRLPLSDRLDINF